jgi:hypothetical protein
MLARHPSGVSCGEGKTSLRGSLGGKCGLVSFDDDAIGRGVELEFAVAGFSAGRIEGINDLLAMALVDDDAVHSQEAEVMADRGLGEVEFVAEAGDIPFAGGEEHDNLQAGFVGEELEKLAEVGKGLLIRGGGLRWHNSSRDFGTTCRHIGKG